MFELLSDPAAWVSFLTLALLEIVLGIDNIIFLSILVSRLPPELQQRAPPHRPRLRDADAHRAPVLDHLADPPDCAALLRSWRDEISGRDLILFLGGAFLLVKSVSEIHGALEGASHGAHDGVKLRSHIWASSSRSALDRHRVLARLRVHGRRPRAARRNHGRRHRHIGARHDVHGAADQRVHRPPPDDQDAGAFVPDPDRRRADRRGLRFPLPEGLSLLRDGVLGRRRDDQHPAEAARQAGRPARAVAPADDAKKH